MKKDLARITFLVEQLPGGAAVEQDFTNYTVLDLLSVYAAVVKEIFSEVEGDLHSNVMRDMLTILAEGSEHNGR